VRPFAPLSLLAPGAFGRSCVRVTAALAIAGASVFTLDGCRSVDLSSSDTAGAGVGTLPGAGGTCAPGHAGCSCGTEAAVADCGSMSSRHGDYVTCAVGRSECQKGTWGPCVADTLVARSLGRATIGSGGLRALVSPTACVDPCDPACTLLRAGAPDVDAAGVSSTPSGGVTISPPCTGLGCQVAIDCSPAATTTLTGTVYDPGGENPVYNADVYIPADVDGKLAPLARGVSAGASCGVCSGTVDAIAATRSGPDGRFVLKGVPSTDVAPNRAVPLVVQVGRWRREVKLTRVPKCQSTAVAPADSRLPRSIFDGQGDRADMPKIAIATGKGDPLECLLLKMGVDPDEFQAPGAGSRSIDLYRYTGLDLGESHALAHAPPGTDLVGSTASLLRYDAVFLPCEGVEDDDNDQYVDNVAAYASAGGRLFTNHFGYAWLAAPTAGVANQINPATGKANPFFGVADWAIGSSFYSLPTTAAVETTLPGGQPFSGGTAFATWLKAVGASLPSGGVALDQARFDVAGVNAALGANEWLRGDAATHAGDETYYFSFDMPATRAGTGDAGPTGCGRVGYGDFHASGASLMDPQAGDTCASDSDCGFTATCLGGQCSASASSFPLACRQGSMTPAEDALEFLLLDLMTCSATANVPTAPPAAPVAHYDPVTFAVDFASPCTASARASGTHVVWRELDWESIVPDTASIAFSAQTVDGPPDGGPPDYATAELVPLAVDTTGSPPPGAAVFIDTGTTGVFNLAIPPLTSHDAFRLSVTLSPTSDHSTPPTLLRWEVKADCLATE
jgi:hypothetical protein